jgi:predicted ATP-grasp superfamily ATP-dependent carboligase
MKESGDGDDGQAITVLVIEYVTGVSMRGQDLPGSWTAEGAAMRRAIVGDFAAVPGIRVVMTLDDRLTIDVPDRVEVRFLSGVEGEFESLASEANYTVLIAPESDNILGEWTKYFGRRGTRTLGSSPAAIELTGDKFRLARHFQRHEIPTPPTWTLESRLFDLPGWSGPVVVKPRMGAGSVNTVIVRDRQFPPWASPRRDYVAQPYLPGTPMSASYLIDTEGGATLLGVARQRIDVDEAGRISYRGGVIGPGSRECPAVVLRAIESVAKLEPKKMGPVPSLRGFVGIDFLLDDEGRATILEINPRPTTSYVGLARLYPPGTIAGAWLAASAGPLQGTVWPDRLRLDSKTPAVSFDADGTIHPRDGKELP